MSAGSGYTPPAVPECAYAPRMTRAAALALAAAGGLRENCVVVLHTDTPTIGTAGNTSATEIELNPVSPTEFGQTARVHTTFSPEAWPGIYNVTTNTITELRDDFGNTAKDVDANGATVHTQFPWHLGSASLRDNYVEDATLTGWDTQVGGVFNNRVIGSTVNLTGKTAGTLQDNVFTNTTVILGAGGASASMSRSQVSSVAPSNVAINHTGTGAFTETDTVHRDNFMVAHSGTGALIISNSTLSNHASAPADIIHAGGGSLSIADSTVVGIAGANPVFDVQAGTTGAVTVTRSYINGTRITKTAGSTGVLTLTAVEFTDGLLTLGAANGAIANQFIAVKAVSASFNLLGPIASPGRNDFTSGAEFNGGIVAVAATATAGVNVQGGLYQNTTTGIVQNRTAGTSSTAFFTCNMRGFSGVTDNGTTDPVNGIAFSRVDLTDAQIVLGNVSGKVSPGTVLQQSSLTGSTLNLTGPNGSAFLNRVRLWGAILTNAGFDGSDLIIDGSGPGATKTMTASQSNRLFNQAFDNWLP